jgi:purine-nucleoside phosphorylase
MIPAPAAAARNTKTAMAGGKRTEAKLEVNRMALFDQLSLENYRSRVEQAAACIGMTYPEKPAVLIVLGSGLGELAGQIDQPVYLPYDQIPGFPAATVPGHKGRFVFGRWGQRVVAVMQGRFHAYEGHSPEDIVLPIRVMQKMGVRHLILTNAAGGIHEEMVPGDLMLIRDHISFWVDSPLRGLNLDEFGPRFPDQTQVYNRHLGDLAIKCGCELGAPLREGIYAYCRGPQFETPAEIRLLRLLGASAVGMSTVPEAIAAAQGGMRTLAISCITNLAAGMLDQPLNHEEVLAVGNSAAQRTMALLTRVLQHLPDEP